MAAPAGAEDMGRKLEEVERAIDKGRARETKLAREARALAKEVRELRRKLIEAARTTQSREVNVSALEARLRALTALEVRRRQDLVRRRTQLADTLGALERLALNPPEALFAHAGSATDKVRGALLLRAIVPELEDRAAVLRAQLAELAAIHTDISRRREEVKYGRRALVKQRRRVARLLKRKAGLQRRTEAEKNKTASRLRALAAEAKDLRELMARLAEAKAVAGAIPLPEPGVAATKRAAFVGPADLRRFSRARGRLSMPVSGRVTRNFGADTNLGTFSKGIAIGTRSGAQVIAPYDGRVVFAGPFRSYGQILIIEHTEGYHTLLAGLRRVDGVANQWLLAGEPVGVMGDPKSGPPTLYLEIRLKGRPIDPLPWLTADNGKVNG